MKLIPEETYLLIAEEGETNLTVDDIDTITIDNNNPRLVRLKRYLKDNKNNKIYGYGFGILILVGIILRFL